MPHLSSMPLSFKCLLSDPDTSIRATVWLAPWPYSPGTHLPDGPKERGNHEKDFYLVVVVVALGICIRRNPLAGQTAPVCPSHGSKCFERDGDFYCNSYEAVQTNKLVRGRAAIGIRAGSRL